MWFISCESVSFILQDWTGLGNFSGEEGWGWVRGAEWFRFSVFSFLEGTWEAGVRYVYVRPIHILLDPRSQYIVAYRTGADFLLSLDLIFILLTGSVEFYDFLFLTLLVVWCLWFNSGHCRLIGKKSPTFGCKVRIQFTWKKNHKKFYFLIAVNKRMSRGFDTTQRRVQLRGTGSAPPCLKSFKVFDCLTRITCNYFVINI